MADPHPFVRANLQRAVRELLKDKHGHLTPKELNSCSVCIARLWKCLGRAVPQGWLGGI